MTTSDPTEKFFFDYIANHTLAETAKAVAAHYRAEGMREAAAICDKRRADLRHSHSELEAEACRNAILAAINRADG